MLARAGVVAIAFAVIVVVVFSASDDASEVRPASNVKAPRGVSVAPFVTLARSGAADVALDSDFTSDRAALAREGVEKRAAPREDRAPGVLSFGPVRVQRSIVERVVEAAKTTDTDPALLMAIADKESSFAPSAKASTSSASGLFQFVEKTWLRALRAFGWRHGHEREAEAIAGTEEKPQVAPRKRAEILRLRNDPYLSAALAAEMLKHDGAQISEQLGRPLTAGETYLVHFLGSDDAARFIEKADEAPQASAARLFPRPAMANKPIFFVRRGRKTKDRSLGEIHEAFEAMMGQRSRRYRDVEDKLPAGALGYVGGRDSQKLF